MFLTFTATEEKNGDLHRSICLSEENDQESIICGNNLRRLNLRIILVVSSFAVVHVARFKVGLLQNLGLLGELLALGKNVAEVSAEILILELCREVSVGRRVSGEVERRPLHLLEAVGQVEGRRVERVLRADAQRVGGVQDKLR